MRERIIEASTGLFFRYGIRSVAMDDIAKELGISKKTIYQHFPDKDTLVGSVLEKDVETTCCSVMEVTEESLNPVEELLRGLELIQEQSSFTNPHFLHDLHKYYPEQFNRFLSKQHNFFLKETKRNLSEGIRQGFYLPEIDIDILALLRIEQVKLGFNHAVYPAESFSLFEIQFQFLQHFLRGILTEAGFEVYREHYKQPQTKYI